MNRLMKCLGISLGLTLASAYMNTTTASDAVDGVVDEAIFADGFETGSAAPLPNILLVIMDDVGVDQMASFGYGGLNPPKMATIDAIADGGLRFRNAWSMPECSPGRSTLFTGRYPLRNNVNQALGPADLANSQVSPYEVTVPKLLKNAGYQNGKFGKAHMAGPENNRAGQGAIGELGWDYFAGWTDGVPPSMDTTAGGVLPEGADYSYSCGYVQDTTRDPEHGADSGACYTRTLEAPNVQCEVITGTNAAGDSPGLQCLTRGGILVPDDDCETTAPSHLNWNANNAHYVSLLTINDGDQVIELGQDDPRSRGYRATLEADATIDWINTRQQQDGPWMATLSFSAAHTPMQPPPGALLATSGSGVLHDFSNDCTKEDPLNMRQAFVGMVEALDTELGRVLVETGIATRDGSGDLVYDPQASNTVIVVVGDNGSFYSTVKLPFDATRSKGTAYQTGVWVPMIVAGPMVEAPGRTVEHMVNMADLYTLFGELAGLDVQALVPRVVDGASMLPYLTDPAQPSIRDYNFTQGALNLQANGAVNGPCVISGQCTHTPMSHQICLDNDGTWWGEDAFVGEGGALVGDLEHCWQVNEAIYKDDPANYETNRVSMGALDYRAIRNENYKLVRNTWKDYDEVLDDGVLYVSEELYRIDQDVPLPLLDREDHDLLLEGPLTPEDAQNYAHLYHAIETLEDTQVHCPGDGNDDGRVDQTDIDNYHAITADWNGSSVYDINLDGITDATDLQLIQDNLGAVCFTLTP